MTVEEYGTGPKAAKKLCISYAFGLTAVLLCLLWIVYAVDKVLPTALYKIDEETNPDAFIAGRAKGYLEGLVAIGPRVTGSTQNEIQAVGYLLAEMRRIELECRIPFSIEEQLTKGSFYLDYKPLGSMNYYQNIRNLVVTLKGTVNPDISPAVLINSHYDTMPESPGGSDAGIMISVMLETIRVLCKSDRQFDNTLVFLFNGAEETYFHGAHGYIADPDRKQEVSVLVNLEATGAGGKEILFQAGPEQAWLMDYYEKVPHPHAQVAGEELFQSGLIPSDTDFRIFRDFDDVIGYDMAYTRNGYRYHTKYDGIENLEIGTFQHTGDNVLALVRALADASEVRDKKQDPVKPTFYDFLGLFLIYYNKTGEIILNVCTILLSIAVAAKCYWDMKPELHLNRLKHIGFILASILCGWIMSLAFMAAVAGILDLCNSSMSWYRNMWLIYGLYCIPTLICTVGSILLLNKFTKNGELQNHTQIYIHVMRLIDTGILFIGTCIGIRGVYVLVFPVLFTSIAFLFIELFKLQNTKYKWIFVYLVSTIMPTLFTYYFGLELLSIFIPITGRMGDGINPDFIIGLFCVALTIMVTCYFVPLITYVEKCKYYLLALATVFAIFFIMSLTSYGFPYQGNSDDPRPQRYYIHHTIRRYYNMNGIMDSRDYGFSFLNLDRNSPWAIEDHVPQLSKRKSLDQDCDNIIYCGLAVEYASTMDELREHIWIPTEAPPTITNPVSLDVVGITRVENIVTIDFTAKGNNNFNIYVSARDNFKIISISPHVKLPETVLEWNGKPVYFMLFTDGFNINTFDVSGVYEEWTPFEFSIKVEILSAEDPVDISALDMAIAGTYHDSTNDGRTEEYQEFINRFPDWASVVPWLGSFDSYVIPYQTIEEP